MGEDSTDRLARLAVENGMATQEQVDECLRLRREGKSRVPIGELLLQRGAITSDQFKRLMLLWRDQADSEREESTLFGQLILDRGLATPDQVQDCLSEQAVLAEKHVQKNLGEIMVHRGILSNSQVKKLLEDRNQLICVCPKCGAKYNVRRDWLGKSPCPQDGTILEAADSHRSVGVVATIQQEAPTPDSPIGMEVGGCRILELIGKGGMAAVYKAKHLGLNRMVAVKMIHTVSKDPMIVRRFHLEAQAIARLEHPNIVQVHDVGSFRGYFFMVMQLLKGETLTRRIQEWGTMVEDQVLAITTDVARGLEAAHAQGIVHRDIKPDNIILTEDGKAKITDFGLAHDTQDTETPDDTAGLVVGTPYYMAPEQWLGQKADERSDLYALGAVMYLMLTGRRPFTGETMHQLMHQHLKVASQPPKSVAPTVSEGLDAVVRKLLAKAPARRYANARALLTDLDRYRRGEDPSAMAEFAEMVRCGFCETMNPANATKCKICGESLKAPTTELELLPAKEDEFKCNGCGTTALKGAKNCPKCKKLFCLRCKKRVAVLRGHCGLCMGHLRKR